MASIHDILSKVFVSASSALGVKLVASDGVDIGDVTVNNAAGSGVYVRPGTSAEFAVSIAAAKIATGAIADMNAANTARTTATLVLPTQHVNPNGAAVSFVSPDAPTIYNLTLTTARTQYSQALPADCLNFEFRCRTAYDVQYAFVTGKVAGPTAPYLTLPAGASYTSPDVNIAAVPVLYFASDASVVMEITAWT